MIDILIMLYTMIVISCLFVSFIYNIAKALMFPETHQSTLVLLLVVLNLCCSQL